jgi:hypothetical protein
MYNYVAFTKSFSFSQNLTCISENITCGKEERDISGDANQRRQQFASLVHVL